MTRFADLTIFWVYLAFVIFFVVMVGVLLIVFSILTFKAEKDGQHSTSVSVLFPLQLHSQFHSVHCPSSIPFTVPVPFHSLSQFHSIYCSNSTLFTVPVPLQFCPVSIPFTVPFHVCMPNAQLLYTHTHAHTHAHTHTHRPCWAGSFPAKANAIYPTIQA